MAIKRLVAAVVGTAMLLALSVCAWQQENLNTQVPSGWVADSTVPMDGYKQLGLLKAPNQAQVELRPQQLLMPDPSSLSTKAPLHNPNSRSAQVLWRTWQKLLAQSQFQQIPLAGAMLAKRLQQRPDPIVYRQIKAWLAKPGLAAEKQALLIDLLADTATPEALAVLLSMAEQGPRSPTYFLVLPAISRAADNRWGGVFHKELSPLLELAWANQEYRDPALLTTLATAIAKVGAPAGVDLLLQTLSAEDAKNGQEQDVLRSRQTAAFLAIPQIRNPDAVPVLSEPLQQKDLGAPALQASGDALAAMGTLEATQKIVDWAKDAPDEGARNLDVWLAQIDDDSLVQRLATEPVESFQSHEVGAVWQKFTLQGSDQEQAVATHGGVADGRGETKTSVLNW